MSSRPKSGEREREGRARGTILGWPILLGQLRAELRRPRFFVAQLIFLSILGLAFLVATWLLVSDGTKTAAQVGQSLFSSFFSLEYLIILVMFPAFSATAISEERSSGTLDLLLISSLRPGEIVLGKFLASSIYCFLFVVASIPLLSIAFLFGGVKPSEVIVAYSILLGMTILISMLGVAISAFFARNLGATLSLYAVVTAVLALSIWLYSSLQGGSGESADRSLVASLLDALGANSADGALRLASIEVACAFAFGYLFLIAANRLRPPSHNKSTGLRALTAAGIAFLVGWALLVLWGHPPVRSGGSAALAWNGSVRRAVGSVAMVLLIAALVFPTETANVSPRSRRAFARFRGILAPLRILAPGASSGWVYAVLASLVASGTLLWAWDAWSIGGVADPWLAGQVVGALLTIPLYVAALSSLGFFLAACDFAPAYGRLTVFFVFVITLLLPVIFLVGEVPDALWTMYYLSPATIWASLSEPVPDQEPRFVLFGLENVVVARALFAAATAGFLATGLAVLRGKGGLESRRPERDRGAPPSSGSANEAPGAGSRAPDQPTGS